MENLNLLFNKTYYKKLGNTAFDKDCVNNNIKIVSTRFTENDVQGLDPMIDEKIKKFTMVTTYPGLLVGTGYAHGTQKSDDDIKIGFSFDYVTGQPYIPASSVKGTLRSFFKYHPNELAKIVESELQKEVDIAKLEEEIFENGDVFFNAVVSRGSSADNLAGGNLLDLDNITPHGEDLTKNPKPLRLLRVMPGARFEFRFILSDGILTSDEKIKLFGIILKWTGVGAKTNVGYGALVLPEDYEREGGHTSSGARPNFNTGNNAANNHGNGGNRNNNGGGNRNNNGGGNRNNNGGGNRNNNGGGNRNGGWSRNGGNRNR